MDESKDKDDSAYGASSKSQSPEGRSSTHSSDYCSYLNGVYSNRNSQSNRSGDMKSPEGSRFSSENVAAVSSSEISDTNTNSPVDMCKMDADSGISVNNNVSKETGDPIADTLTDTERLKLAFFSQGLRIFSVANGDANGINDMRIVSTDGINYDDVLKELTSETELKNQFSCIISMCDGVVLHTTDSMTEILDFPKDMWIGRSFIDLVHPNDRMAFTNYVTKDICDQITFDRNSDQNGESLSFPEKTSFFCRIRRYRGLKSGFNVTEKKVVYLPCQLSVYFHQMSFAKSENIKEKHVFLVVCTKPVRSAYTTQNEEISDTKFIIRHSESGHVTHVDPEVVTLFGYLPQDMFGQSIFNYYHPEDIEILKELYSKASRGHGHPSQSRPFRFLCQNGDYATVVIECSMFINPWSRKVESVLAQYCIIKGPTNTDVVTPVEMEKEVPQFPDEVINRNQLVQNDILKLLSQEFDGESVGLVSLSDSGDSSKVSSSPVSYNQLNYNDNIQRFFDSNPKIMSDETNSSESNKEDTNRVTVVKNPNKTISVKSNNTSVIVPTISTGIASTNTNNSHLTEALLYKHNEDMKKQMVQKYREKKLKCNWEKKPKSKQRRETDKTKGDESIRGIKRCGTHSSENEHKTLKTEELEGVVEDFAASNVTDQLLVSVYKEHSYPIDCRRKYCNTANSKTTSQLTAAAITAAVDSSRTRGLNSSTGVGDLREQSIKGSVDSRQRLMQNQHWLFTNVSNSEAQENKSLPESQRNMSTDRTTRSEEINLVPDSSNQSESIDPSNISSYYSSSMSLFSHCSSENDSKVTSKDSSQQNYSEEEDERFMNTGYNVKSVQNFGMFSVVQKEPPWDKEVVMTSYLIYQYQLGTRRIEEVLKEDNETLNELHQPADVVSQLNQMFLEMKMAGLKGKLDFEEGYSSSFSTSSDEEGVSLEKLNRRQRKYDRMAFLFEENAPLPPPMPEIVTMSR